MDCCSEQLRNIAISVSNGLTFNFLSQIQDPNCEIEIALCLDLNEINVPNDLIHFTKIAYKPESFAGKHQIIFDFPQNGMEVFHVKIGG